MPPDDHRPLKPFLLMSGIVALLGAGLIVYSQTAAFVWDEGFHLVAAQLVLAGKKPYIDFCFPQTPLNTYLNAAWMRIFGQSWRAVHVLAALALTGSIFLTADFILMRCPVRRWRLPGAIAAAFLLGANLAVVEFATSAQAYAMCMFLGVAGFRVAVASVEQEGLLLPFAAGLLSGGAAGFSLLIAAVCPVLLIWILRYSRAGSRISRLAVFLAGAAIPFLPVLWLFLQAPKLVFFNVIQYQALYRRVNWGDATQHDFEVFLSWVDSTSAMILLALVAASLVYMKTKSGWTREERAPFYLCGWLALAASAELATAHPTFTRYFIVIAPFLAMLAVPGLYSLGWQLFHPDRPEWPMIVLTIVLSLGIVKGLYDHRDSTSWKNIENVAHKVVEVTPPDAPLFADELVYFLLRLTPPPGMEFAYSHQLELPAARAASLHILSNKDLRQMVAAGTFHTLETCDDNDFTESLKLPQTYVHKEDVGDCRVFWELAPAK